MYICIVNGYFGIRFEFYTPDRRANRPNLSVKFIREGFSFRYSFFLII